MKSYRIFLTSALISLAVVFLLNLPMLLFQYANITRYEVEYDACQEELKIIHALCKPKFFIPVHGEQRHLQITG